MLKKSLVMVGLIAMLAGCGTSIDKDDYPEGGIVVFVGYDKGLYFLADDEDDVDTSSSSGKTYITYDKDRTFTTNDVYYMYPYRNKEDLNKLLKQFKHEEIK